MAMSLGLADKGTRVDPVAFAIVCFVAISIECRESIRATRALSWKGDECG